MQKRLGNLGDIVVARIGSLICALVLLVFASPSHALTFQFSFGGVQGLISGLEDNSANQAADSVLVTVSPIGGLGEYVPAVFNSFTVSSGAMIFANFSSLNASPPGFALNVGLIVGQLEILDDEGDLVFGTISFSPVAETPLPGALPLFATGLGALGLMTWRRKRKAVAA